MNLLMHLAIQLGVIQSNFLIYELSDTKERIRKSLTVQLIFAPYLKKENRQMEKIGQFYFGRNHTSVSTEQKAQNILLDSTELTDELKYT